jgi:hypothetical protein
VGNRSVYYSQVLERVKTLPGVKAAAVDFGLPLTGEGTPCFISAEWKKDPASPNGLKVQKQIISPDYFNSGIVRYFNTFVQVETNSENTYFDGYFILALSDNTCDILFIYSDKEL